MELFPDNSPPPSKLAYMKLWETFYMPAGQIYGIDFTNYASFPVAAPRTSFVLKGVTDGAVPTKE